MIRNEKKVSFILCTNSDLWLGECIRYIQALEVPEGIEVEILEVRDAVSMTAGYNEGMNATDAKYKVYLHQDVFIINRHFIQDILDIFSQDANIGMIGLVGSQQMPENAVMWSGDRVQNSQEQVEWENYRYHLEDGVWEVECIDGLLMATQYDVPWREDLFDGWDFYDVSQSCEMRRRGYSVVVPVQKHVWYVHGDKLILSLWNYNKYRKIFMEYYRKSKKKEGVTVLLLAHNQQEYTKIAVDSFRRFGKGELSLVLVDNGSTDGLKDWASCQTDLTYVLLDEGPIGWGKAINMVMTELQIATDVLVIQANYALTPGCLQQLLEALYQSEDIGAVGGISNGARFHQGFTEEITDYGAAVQAALSQKPVKIRQSMSLFHGAVLFKKETLDRLGVFEEGVDGLPALMQDYCLRMIMSEIKMVVTTGALLWNMENASKGIVAGNDLKVLAEKWQMHYFNGSYNENLILPIEAAPEDEISVLEVGCDCGGTLLEIKNRFPKAKVFGVELNERAASIASHFATVETANIEEKGLGFSQGSLDYIIFGDVLEHLRDPEETLVYCRKLLRKGGKIIANIPNVMHISVMEQLLRGDFTYTDTGLLDRTHIHLFTYYEIERMFQRAGYRLCDTNSVVLPITKKQQELIDKLMDLKEGASRFMYETFQYNIKACVYDVGQENSEGGKGE